MPRPRLEWAVGTQGTERANSLGYAQSNRLIEKGLRKIADLTPEAEVAVHYCYPKNDRIFQPREGKINVLFSMYENEVLDPCLPRAFEQVDLILTPSRWCAESFRQHTDKPIEVVPLGVDSHAFPYRKRRLRPGEKFRWLYLGAPNARKFTILPKVYQSLLGRMPEVCELYIKTQGSLVSEDSFLATLPPGPVKKDGDILRFHNCTIDNRFVSWAELLEIYHSAHGFLFLHCGEGFGLTGLEAMATGLAPVISDSSGVREYIGRGNSYPVEIQPQWIESFHDEGRRREWLPWPHPEKALEAIGSVMTNYRKAQKKGKQAAEDARKFSWERTARGICSALGRHGILIQ